MLKRLGKITAVLVGVLVSMVCLLALPTEAQTQACDGCVYGTFNGSPACLKDGNLHICQVNFPDQNFRNYVLIRLNKDKDTFTEASSRNVVTIAVSEITIVTMKGIEFFTELSSLHAYSVKLSELDLSHNTKLERLNCDWNNLTTLDLSGLTRLKSLQCKNNPLKKYDLKDNINLWSYPGQTVELSRWQQPVTAKVEQSNSTPAFAKPMVDLLAVFGAYYLGGQIGATAYSATGELIPAEIKDNRYLVLEEFSKTIFVKLRSNSKTPSPRNYVSVEATIQLSCDHVWREATCAHPRRCYICKEMGSAELLSHSWTEATCKSPKRCTSCGKTEGEKGEHMWTEMKYCTDAPYCITCKRKGTAQYDSHDLVEPTLWDGAYCRREGCKYRGKPSYSVQYALPFTIPAAIVILFSGSLTVWYLVWVCKNNHWVKWSRRDIVNCWCNMELNGDMDDLRNNWGKAR